MGRLSILAVLLLTGCFGSSRQEETRTDEEEEIAAGPLIVDSPIGQFVVHPTRLSRRNRRVERSEAKVEYQMPPIAELAPAMLGGLGGPVAGAGLVGLVSAFLLRRSNQRAAAAERHRDEMIDGVEQAKAKLPPEDWLKVRTELEKAQSTDTKAAVKRRVG